jgi:hypothetical protein
VTRPTIREVLGQTIIKEELGKIFNDFMPLIFENSTARMAHKILEEIVEIRCNLDESL